MADYKAIYQTKLTTAEQVAQQVQSGWVIGMDAGPTQTPATVSYTHLTLPTIRLV